MATHLVVVVGVDGDDPELVRVSRLESAHLVVTSVTVDILVQRTPTLKVNRTGVEVTVLNLQERATV